MSTSNPAPAPSTAQTILTALQNVGGWVTVGATIAGVALPLVKGLITDIKKITSPQGVVTYQVVISTDEAEIAGVVALADVDLAAINEYLVSAGLPPLVVPPAPAPGS